MLKERKDRLRTFGQKLYSMRKIAKMTQMQLADMLDVDYRQISRYETGEAEMGAMLYDKMLSVIAPHDSQTDFLLQQWNSLTPENKERLLDLAGMMNRAQK